MRVLVVEPGKRPAEREIDGSLEAMQAIVGGTIQAIYPFEEPVALICNDEAKLLNMGTNRMLNEIDDIIFGTFFLCGAPHNSESFGSLSEEQLERYANRFKSIELIVPIGDAVFVMEV